MCEEYKKITRKTFIFIILIITLSSYVSAISPEERCNQLYTVKRGDYLWGVWEKYASEIPWKTFVEINKNLLKEKGRVKQLEQWENKYYIIYAGQKLKVCKNVVEVTKEKRIKTSEIKKKTASTSYNKAFSMYYIDKCSDLKDAPTCISHPLKNVKCVWTGKSCEPYSFTIRRDVGKNTIAEELAAYFEVDITKKEYPKNMPSRIMIKGNKLKLEWNEKIGKWDYVTKEKKHYKVYGGEIVYFLPDDLNEEYFYEVQRRIERLIRDKEEIFNYIEKDAEWIKDYSCARFVTEAYKYIFGEKKTNDLGVYGHAWHFPKNIIGKKGKEIFNDKDSKKNVLDYNSLIPGDIICMYNSRSLYRPELEKGRALGNKKEINFTHVAIYLGKRGNKHIIIHLVDGKVRVDDLQEFAGPGKQFFVRRVLRPNQELLWGKADKIAQPLKSRKEIEKLTRLLEERGIYNARIIAENIFKYSKYKTPEYFSLTLSKMIMGRGLEGLVKEFLHWRLECGVAKFGITEIKTFGPMAVNVYKAIELAKKHEGKKYSVGEMRDKLCSWEEGIKYGILYLEEIAAIYNKNPAKLERGTLPFIIADYMAGEYTSRNAALQKQVSELASKPLKLDGDLLIWKDIKTPSQKKSETEKAIISLLSSILNEEQIRKDLEKEKTKEFEDTQTYKLIKQMYKQKTNKQPEYAIVPDAEGFWWRGTIPAKTGTQQRMKEYLSAFYDFCEELECVV